jgi:hypothetical protein
LRGLFFISRQNCPSEARTGSLTGVPSGCRQPRTCPIWAVMHSSICVRASGGRSAKCRRKRQSFTAIWVIKSLAMLAGALEFNLSQTGARITGASPPSKEAPASTSASAVPLASESRPASVFASFRNRMQPRCVLTTRAAQIQFRPRIRENIGMRGSMSGAQSITTISLWESADRSARLSQVVARASVTEGHPTDSQVSDRTGGIHHHLAVAAAASHVGGHGR